MYGPAEALNANTPVSNGQTLGQVLAVAVWGTPPPCESLFRNWKVLFTPTTSFATSGVKAVVVSVAAPKLISIVTHLGGVQAAAADDVEVWFVQEFDAQ